MMASWLCWVAWVVTCVVPILVPPACPSPLNDSTLAPAHHNISNIIPQDVNDISNGHLLSNYNTSNIIPQDAYGISNEQLLRNDNTSNIIPQDVISNEQLLRNDNTSNIIPQDVISNEQLQNNIDSAHEGFTNSAILDLSTSVIKDATAQISNIANVVAIVKHVANAVQTTLSAIPIVGSIIGIFTSILSFTLFPSANSVMREEFKVVNQKLDAITLQLRNIKEEMQVNTEFQAWMSTYINWEYTIRNGEAKLVDTIEIIQTARDERIRLKAAKGFVDYFRDQDIEGAIRNVLRISTTGSNSVTAPNLLELYGRQNECDIKGLSLLMLTLMDMTISATKQLYMYSLLVYGTKDLVDQQVIKIYEQFYHARQQYQEIVYACYSNSINNAKSITSNILTEKHGLQDYALTEYVHTKLSKSVPWYEWAVSQYSKVYNLEDGVCLNIHGRGMDYFTSENNNRKLLVMWQDPSDKIQECNKLELARNIIPFQPCDGCDGYMKSGQTFLTKQNCSNFLNTFVNNIDSCISNYFANASFVLKDSYKLQLQEQTSFIASAVKPVLNICYTHGCNGHGECRPIPYTNNYMCVCEPFYGGNDCEQNLHPSTLQAAADVLDKMRKHLGQFIGVPDDVDIFLALRSFSDQLAQTQTSIIASIKYHQILTSYGQEFDDAEYIAEKYIALMNRHTLEQQFIEDLKRIKFDFDHFFSNLKKAILGTGLFLQSDILYYYKQSLIDQQPCTQAYNMKIEMFMNNILKFDEIISEAQIRLILGSSKTQDIEQAKETMERLGTAASQRQASYKQHWQQESCPFLPSLSSCGTYTYQGLNVTMTCPSDYYPVPEIITCQRSNGSLEWSGTPKCVKYEWGPWSSWSACSKSCGSGQQTRTRTKPHHNPDRESRTCNEIDCCHSSFNKFKCSNGICIENSKLCDGINNCRNNDDESRYRCNYLRSGDRIALRDQCEYKWMSGDGDFPRFWAFQLRSCPGASMDGKWSMCALERMDKIEAKGRRHGEAIRHGDKVGIMFRNDRWACHSETIHWFITINRCPGDSMAGQDWHNCWGEVWTIYAPARMGSCDGSVFSDCKGQPIQKGDIVFIRGDTSDSYLSAANGWVAKRGCPGHSITLSSLNGCSCEQWELHY